MGRGGGGAGGWHVLPRELQLPERPLGGSVVLKTVPPGKHALTPHRLTAVSRMFQVFGCRKPTYNLTAHVAIKSCFITGISNVSIAASVPDTALSTL